MDGDFGVLVQSNSICLFEMGAKTKPKNTQKVQGYGCLLEKKNPNRNSKPPNTFKSGIFTKVGSKKITSFRMSRTKERTTLKGTLRRCTCPNIKYYKKKKDIEVPVFLCESYQTMAIMEENKEIIFNIGSLGIRSRSSQ